VIGSLKSYTIHYILLRACNKDAEKVCKVFLCLINKVPQHEDVCGSGVTAPSFLTSALDGGELLVSYPGSFAPQRKFGRRLDGSQRQSGRYGDEKISTPTGNRNPAVQPVASHYTA
jgi:hypothetical protein